MAKKLSQRVEAAVRESYYPGKLQAILHEMLDIETHALWLATPEGMKSEGYSVEEAAMVLKKQSDRKEELERRAVFYRKLVDRKSTDKKPKKV